MDASDVEPRDGLHKDQSRLQVLLRGSYGEAAQSDGCGSVPKRISTYASARRARSAAALEIAARDLRELDERPVSRRRAPGVHPGVFSSDGGSLAAHVPNLNEAAGTHGRIGRRAAFA